jgi:ribosomal protein S7
MKFYSNPCGISLFYNQSKNCGANLSKKKDYRLYSTFSSSKKYTVNNIKKIQKNHYVKTKFKFFKRKFLLRFFLKRFIVKKYVNKSKKYLYNYKNNKLKSIWTNNRFYLNNSLVEKYSRNNFFYTFIIKYNITKKLTINKHWFGFHENNYNFFNTNIIPNTQKDFVDKSLYLHDKDLLNKNYIHKNRIYPLKKFHTPIKSAIYKESIFFFMSILLSRILTVFVKQGLKNKMEIFVYNYCLLLKNSCSSTDNKLLYSHRFLLNVFLINLPKLTIKGVRRGSVIYKVPFLLTPYQQYTLLLKWFKNSVFFRSENTHSMRMLKESFELFNKNVYSDTLKKKTILSKAVLSGRSFSHYRWL